MIPFFIMNSVHFDSISLQLLISKCTNHLGFIMNGKGFINPFMKAALQFRI